MSKGQINNNHQIFLGRVGRGYTSHVVKYITRNILSTLPSTSDKYRL